MSYASFSIIGPRFLKKALYFQHNTLGFRYLHVNGLKCIFIILQNENGFFNY